MAVLKNIEIAKDYLDGLTCSKLVEKYRVSRTTLTYIFREQGIVTRRNSQYRKREQSLLVPDYYFVICKKGAQKRNYEFSISHEDMDEQFRIQDGRCFYTGRTLTLKKDSHDFSATASLDRRDNKLGYIKKNIVWVHKDVNFIKGDYSEKEFLEICKEVSIWQQ